LIGSKASNLDILTGKQPFLKGLMMNWNNTTTQNVNDEDALATELISLI
jgi:hypothetical protein